MAKHTISFDNPRAQLVLYNVATEWREYREYRMRVNGRQYRVRQTTPSATHFVAERFISDKAGWKHYAYPNSRLSNWFGSLAEAQMACEEHAQKEAAR